MKFASLATSVGAAYLLLQGCNSTPTPIPSSSPSNNSSKSSTGVQRLEGVANGVQSEAGLTVPKGFTVEQVTQGLDVPRRLAFAPGGTAQNFDLFVSESKAGRVTVLRMKSGKVVQKSTFSDKLDQPYGLAFWKNWLYIGNTGEVVRLPYQSGFLSSDAAPQEIAKLTRDGYNQHWTRNLLFSNDGKQLFATVGSSCNTCEEEDPQRAAISVMNPDGSGKRVFASGLRNPVGLAWYPGTNELWTAVNERDNLGDDTPPDYITKVKAGAFYGWPYAYADIKGTIRPDPSFGDKDPGKVKSTVSPDVPVQAHSAALGVAFYPFKGGNFPADYAGDAFLTYHGSWNRSAKTGYKVVRVNFEGGKAKSVSDFVSGYLKDGDVWGRPVDVQVGPDGALYFSDDGGGKIWRVRYTGN